MNPILKIENISKQYRLGVVGTGTLSHDLNRWWHTVRGKEDPYLKIGETNDRAVKGDSQYVWALKDISFEVQPGEVLGIIGKNGAGKSTLLKILSQVTGPTTGTIKSRGRIASLLEVGTGFHPELTGKENIYLNGAILGMTKAEIKSKFDEIVAFAGVSRYIDTPVKRYSSGMKVRLAFAVAAHLEPEILVVDEVLAVGDAEFQKKAIGKMQDIAKGEGRTVLFVSHDMGAIKNLCSKLILLENGEIVFNGNVELGLSKYINTNSTQNEFKLSKNIIKNIKINDAKNFISGNNLLIEIEFLIYKPVVNAYISLIVNNDFGKKILEFHSRGNNESIDLINDTILIFEIENFNIHIGKYNIDLKIFDGNTYEFKNCSSFFCITTPKKINQFHKKENDFYFNYRIYKK